MERQMTCETCGIAESIPVKQTECPHCGSDQLRLASIPEIAANRPFVAQRERQAEERRNRLRAELLRGEAVTLLSRLVRVKHAITIASHDRLLTEAEYLRRNRLNSIVPKAKRRLYRRLGLPAEVIALIR